MNGPTTGSGSCEDSPELFDLDRKILQENLYGVDLNEEAVHIAKLSLWIKTAVPGKELTSLDHNLRVGNSIVADSQIDPKAFDWKAEFPEVFDPERGSGGFDVVIGNPPYIRQEWLSPIKPYLQSRYAAYHGMADLYVYFYELGLEPAEARRPALVRRDQQVDEGRLRRAAAEVLRRERLGGVGR